MTRDFDIAARGVHVLIDRALELHFAAREQRVAAHGRLDHDLAARGNGVTEDFLGQADAAAARERVVAELSARYDAVFMDVARIPFAVSFPDVIRQAIADSRVLIALIGPEWHRTIDAPADFVRMEIEVALERQVPVLPVLIGSTPMPAAAGPLMYSAGMAQNTV